MKLLCDINVWLALSLINHEHHGKARSWFDRLHGSDIALFCRVTQQGFLRLSTNTAIFRDVAMTNSRATRVFCEFMRHERISWQEEPANLEPLWFELASAEKPSTHLWMDAYLAAFAQLAQARLVSFDQGFSRFKKLDWIDLNEVK
ncbi:MAG: PIN domain-containing protein [Methylacidiphilales bacterium]|nr:PIN domain-containing protein [Candidatus Methylacidiphilales bacterium]